MSEFLERYSATITKMGAFPDKMVINKLTKLAHDVLMKMVPGVTPQDIANLLQKKILRADAKCKVPIMYLIDSIFHNVNGGYIQLFTGNLCSIYHVSLIFFAALQSYACATINSLQLNSVSTGHLSRSQRKGQNANDTLAAKLGEARRETGPNRSRYPCADKSST